MPRCQNQTTKHILSGDTASVNVRTNAFDLKIRPSSHQNRLRGESEFAIGANGDIRVVNGTITFCAPDVNSWNLQADQIYLNQSSGRGWASDVIVRSKIRFYARFGFSPDDQRLTDFCFQVTLSAQRRVQES